jgi:uncharacterized protein
MKKIFFSALAVLIVLGAAFLIGEKIAVAPEEATLQATATQIDDGYKRAKVQVNDSVFSALVSDTLELRARGLSGRLGLDEDEAMLFVFDKPEAAGFWMKDMLFSIDIVWIDENYRIISIASDVSPKTFPNTFFPKSAAKYVLEFSAGTTKRLGIKEGDFVSISRD